MATHFLEFSEVLPNLRDDEEAWLREQLTKIYVSDGREYPEDALPADFDSAEADWHGPRFLLDLSDEPVDHPGFHFEFRDGESQGDGSNWGRHAWFYAQNQGNPDYLAQLVRKFLARFRPDECWEFSYACGCNKPCVGAFGGDTYFVTASGIQCGSDLLARVRQEFRPRQHRKEGQQTATLTVDVDYNPAMTDPESLASAMDTLLETALSTPGILDDYGDPVVGEFVATREYVAHVISEVHNRGPAIDTFHSDAPITLQRLTAYYETAEAFNWDRDGITMVDPGANPPTDLDAWEADHDREDDEDE